MARKAKRIKAGEVSLTKDGLKMIEAEAFKNCRTVDEELTYIVERALSGKPVASPMVKVERYDDAPVVVDEPTVAGEQVKALPPAGWTQEQEDAIYVLGKGAGMGEAQITTLRLIHKDYDSVKAAIEAEAVPA